MKPFIPAREPLARYSRSKYPRAVYGFRSIRTLSGARKPLPVSRAIIKAREHYLK